MLKFTYPSKTLTAVTFYGISMGLLEAVVVIYLRIIYFPNGFSFPLSPMEIDVAITEVWRELATLVMLITVGYIAGKNLTSRFAWFLYSFAIWDIFYYIFLKLFIDWPESLLTDDVLFLIPIMWVGPVISPILIALIMILFAAILLKTANLEKRAFITLLEWSFLIFGSLILIAGFTWEYARYVKTELSQSDFWVWPTNDILVDISTQFIPQDFNWFLYSLGVIIILSGILLYWDRGPEKF